MTDRWIVVRNWERFQHPDAARSSVPPWIKLFTELWRDEAFLELSVNRRLMLLGLWVEYASTRRRVPVSTASLARRLAMTVRMSDLEALSDAGFIRFSASKPASNDASNLASTEERREELPLTPPAAGTVDNTIKCRQCGEPVAPRARCKACGATSRQAGSNPRELAKPSAMERARTFTRNAGVEYERVDFFAELARFDLTAEQVHELDELRVKLSNGVPDDNPFIDGD